MKAQITKYEHIQELYKISTWWSKTMFEELFNDRKAKKSPHKWEKFDESNRGTYLWEKFNVDYNRNIINFLMEKCRFEEVDKLLNTETDRYSERLL